jgi:predicted dienelactone hydrolase
MRLISPTIWVFFLLCLALPAHAGESAVKTRVIAAKVKIYEWLPPGFGQAKRQWPLVLFSHGLDGCGAQSEFLTEALAAHGYVVAAPDHADATCGRRTKPEEEGVDSTDDETAGGDDNAPRGLFGRHKVQEKLEKADAWTDQTHRNRADDMRYTLDYVLKDPATGPFIDQKRMGLSGHSLGGYTVLGIAGGWPSWKDARYKAVLALSPYAAPFAAHDTLKDIGIPVMYQGGTRDFGITPSIRKPGGAYDLTAPPRYFVEFTRTGHFGFSDMVGNRHDVMNDYAIAFFDKYLMGKDDGVLDGPPEPGVAEYRADP